MAFPSSTLPELDAKIASTISSRLGDGSGPFTRANTVVSARAQAGASFGLRSFISYIFKQMHPATADPENVPMHGAIRRLPQKTESIASGTVTFTGTDPAPIVAGTVLQREDGTEYIVQEEVALSGGVATGIVKAAVGGSASNIETGTLSFVSPLANVNSTASIDAVGILGGVDEEDVSEWQGRIVDRWREPPQGGSLADYTYWARQVPGVTRAWPSSGEMGEGTVTVRYVMDNEEDIFPPNAHVETVKAFIEDLRAATAEIFIVSPIPKDLDLTIAVSPLNEAVKLAIKAELNDLIFREAKPTKTILLSKIREAVSIASGENDNSVILPAANVIHGTGEMARLGVITWQEVD